MGGLQPPVVLLKTTDIQAAFDRKDASHQELVLVPEMSLGIPRIKQDGSHQCIILKARLPQRQQETYMRTKSCPLGQR
jgi:hypothetical protein